MQGSPFCDIMELVGNKNQNTQERKILAMSIISHNWDNENRFSSTVDNFFKEHHIGALMKQSNFYKEKGISCLLVFKLLFTLVFTGKNLFRTIEAQNTALPFAKDVEYRFLNSVHYHWQRFLMLLASSIIRNKLVDLTSDDRVNVLIVDDSIGFLHSGV